jgi:Ca-activated chloride channel family protein
MSFGSPWLLLFLLVIPVAAVAYVLFERRRHRAAAAWGSPALLPNMARAPGWRRGLPVVLFLLGGTLLLVGFARPEAKFNSIKPGATIVLAIDISGSMGAHDVPPSRLGYADSLLTSFVNALPSTYRVALVTFSSDYSVRVPPTYDRAAVIAALPRTAQLQGSAISDGIGEAIKVAEQATGTKGAAGQRPPAAVLAVSDGSQNAGNLTPPQVALLARKAGVPVSGLVVGTLGGSVTQHVTVTGSKQPFTEVTRVPVDASTLKQIASGTGGALYENGQGADLDGVYQTLGSHLIHERNLREITVAVTVAALVLMLLGSLCSGILFRRVV